MPWAWWATSRAWCAASGSERMPTPDLIVFDCDGVLIDSEHLSARAEARLFQRLGLAIDEAYVTANFVGLSWATQIGMIEARFDWRAPDNLLELARAEIRDLFESELKPIPGVTALLDRLEQRATPRCVASSSDPDRLRLTLGLTGLHDRLAPHIFSATMVKNGKPAPDLFLHAAREMGVAPESCVVIEDSVPGITAARAAGMRVIGFVGGSQATPDLGSRLGTAGAERIAAHMDEVAPLLGL